MVLSIGAPKRIEILPSEHHRMLIHLGDSGLGVEHAGFYAIRKLFNETIY